MLVMIIKECACGLCYTTEAWFGLPACGRMEDEHFWPLPTCLRSLGWTYDMMPLASVTAYELRNCPCGSTMALEVSRTGVEPYSDDEIAQRLQLTQR